MNNRFFPSRPRSADILLDKQSQVSGSVEALTDNAPRPLFFKVTSDVHSKRTFKAFIAMLDNYDAYVNNPEFLNEEEMNEINEFLDAILETKVMQVAYIYITQYLGFSFTLDSFKEKLFRMWFQLHSLEFASDETPRAVRRRMQAQRQLSLEAKAAVAAMRQQSMVDASGGSKAAQAAEDASSESMSNDVDASAAAAHTTNLFELPPPPGQEGDASAVKETPVESSKEIEAIINESTFSPAGEAAAVEGEGGGDGALVNTDDADLEKPQKVMTQVKYCSGFEHVFMGEISINSDEQIGHVLGYHNWLKFYFDEADSLIDYLGTRYSKPSLSNSGAPFVSVRFRWDQDGRTFVKERGSFFVGVSPEFSIAVSTICFLETETPELFEKCKWELKPGGRFVRHRVIDGYKFDYYVCKDKEFLVSCFEELIGLTDAKRAERKRNEKVKSQPIQRKTKVRGSSEWNTYCRDMLPGVRAAFPAYSDKEAYAEIQKMWVAEGKDPSAFTRKASVMEAAAAAAASSGAELALITNTVASLSVSSSNGSGNGKAIPSAAKAAVDSLPELLEGDESVVSPSSSSSSSSSDLSSNSTSISASSNSNPSDPDAAARRQSNSGLATFSSPTSAERKEAITPSSSSSSTSTSTSTSSSFSSSAFNDSHESKSGLPPLGPSAAHRRTSNPMLMGLASPRGVTIPRRLDASKLTSVHILNAPPLVQTLSNTVALSSPTPVAPRTIV